MRHNLFHGNHPDPGRQRILRFVLLLVVCLAFARLVWRLDTKALWLDEAFSLQRAESSWPELIAGCLPLTDGVMWIKTTDQHPFAYFVFLGLLLRAAGESEFALRFPSVMAATLVVPVAWVFARRLTRGRSRALPALTPLWAALLMAINPFYLWFGQEVRMYAQVGLLALLSSYLLLRAVTTPQAGRRRVWLVGYGLALALLLTSHYFAPLLLPVHALMILQELGRKRRGWAVAAAIGLAALALASGSIALWLLARDLGAGANWAAISPRIMIPDLVNAFSLGLSVDFAQVWPLDVLYGAVAATGALVGLVWARRSATPRGWLLPALLIVPPALLLIINTIRPAYMTARHMSLVSGFFVLLVGAGVAWLWEVRRWAGALVAAVLLAGASYSTVNFYTSPRYDNGDMQGLGDYLTERVQPGDLVIFRPLPWLRLYRYYLPLAAIEQGERAGYGSTWRSLPDELPKDAPLAKPQSAVKATLDQIVLRIYGAQARYNCPTPPSPVEGRPASAAQPLVGLPRAEFATELVALAQRHRRVWLIHAGGADPEVTSGLTQMFRADDRAFAHARSNMNLYLLLPMSPVRDQPPAAIEHPTNVVFGVQPGQVRLIGYEVGRPLAPGLALPVTLYWQPVTPLAQRYKYILRLVADGAPPRVLAQTEMEPYSGLLPTPLWPAGATIVEYSGVPTSAGADSGKLYLSLQVYDAQTLQKLPVTVLGGAAQSQDPEVILPIGR